MPHWIQDLAHRPDFAGEPVYPMLDTFYYWRKASLVPEISDK
jgi:hypothetical protein